MPIKTIGLKNVFVCTWNGREVGREEEKEREFLSFYFMTI